MTVHALKNAIMEKEWHLLQGVPSKSLEIWKVSIAVESLRVKLVDIKLKDSAWDGVEKLGPRLTLGGAFPEPPVGILSCILQVSMHGSCDKCPSLISNPKIPLVCIDAVNRTPHKDRPPALRFLDGSRTVYKVEGVGVRNSFGNLHVLTFPLSRLIKFAFPEVASLVSSLLLASLLPTKLTSLKRSIGNVYTSTCS
jgi:hypothetical protein